MHFYMVFCSRVILALLILIIPIQAKHNYGLHSIPYYYCVSSSEIALASKSKIGPWTSAHEREDTFVLNSLIEGNWGIISQMVQPLWYLDHYRLYLLWGHLRFEGPRQRNRRDGEPLRISTIRQWSKELFDFHRSNWTQGSLKTGFIFYLFCARITESFFCHSFRAVGFLLETFHVS